ncbi:MAG: hypothetical protein QM783_05610 [Phycisphaerales bacterium]
MTTSNPLASPDPDPARGGDESNSETPSVKTLLEAMGRGERQAAAEFVMRYGPLIRRRVRGKLRPSMRRLFDSEDILSTLGRRLDNHIHGGSFEPRSETELWSLVYAIAERSVVEKAKTAQLLAEQANRIEHLDRDDPLFCIVWDPEVLNEDDYAELVSLLGDLYEASGGEALTRIKERGFGIYVEAGVVA